MNSDPLDDSSSGPLVLSDGEAASEGTGGLMKGEKEEEEKVSSREGERTARKEGERRKRDERLHSWLG